MEAHLQMSRTTKIKELQRLQVSRETAYAMVHFTLSKHFHVRTNTIAVFTVGIQSIRQNTYIAFQGLLKEHILKQISIKTLGGLPFLLLAILS